YMTPSAFVALGELPLTPNGKVDHKALPEPEQQSIDYHPPRTREEEILCALFAKVLGLERVGIDENFFELGGDSIISIQLVSQARQAGIIITVRDVFSHQSVEALTAVAKLKHAQENFEPDIAIGTLPVTPIMRWLEERRGPINRFSQSTLLQVPAELGE